jgi:hypothetical protein
MANVSAQDHVRHHAANAWTDAKSVTAHSGGDVTPREDSYAIEDWNNVRHRIDHASPVGLELQSFELRK